MARGRKITLHMMDGTANGIIKGKIGNWIGQVTFGKMTQLADLTKDKDVKRAGIYILAGPDPDELNAEAIYIGKSDNVAKRLKQHSRNPKKDFSEYVAIITSSDESLTESPILYLESRLIDLAHQAGRATIKNGNQGTLSSLPLADTEVMDDFLEHLELILPVLGLNFILPKPSRSTKTEDRNDNSSNNIESPIFYLKTTIRKDKMELQAQAQMINGEFVVFKDSVASLRRDGSYASHKERLIHNKSLIKENDKYRFIKDVPLNSPSAAASVIVGRNKNGSSVWKLESGENYGDWLDKQIDQEDDDIDA